MSISTEFEVVTASTMLCPMKMNHPNKDADVCCDASYCMAWVETRRENRQDGEEDDAGRKCWKTYVYGYCGMT